MATFQFACPHCNGPFEVEDPPAGKALACPSCGEPVALPDELPPPGSESVRLESGAGESAAGESVATPAPFVPFDFRDQSTSIVRHRPSRRKKRATIKKVEHLSRSERQRRQQRRSVAMMIVGMVVLCIAVVVLSRF
ncbi:MAG: hypothetical protein HY288_09820 [Planctomycetia bacterium]|nr:hypothetical protein [Planctomycetia bacterium]